MCEPNFIFIHVKINEGYKAEKRVQSLLSSCI